MGSDSDVMATAVQAFRYLVALLGIALVVLLALRNRRSRPARESIVKDEEILHFGAALLHDGFDYYADWSAAVMREYGGDVAEHLPQLYELCQEINTHSRNDWNEVVAKISARGSMEKS